MAINYIMSLWSYSTLASKTLSLAAYSLITIIYNSTLAYDDWFGLSTFVNP
jgi:hypothetical protein